jgi:hypothetical protein
LDAEEGMEAENVLADISPIAQSPYRVVSQVHAPSGLPSHQPGLLRNFIDNGDSLNGESGNKTSGIDEETNFEGEEHEHDEYG